MKIMIKLLIHFLLLASFSLGRAQIIKTKDGLYMGERNSLISMCEKTFKNEMTKIKGWKVDTYKLCSCVYDNLIPKLNSWEIDKAEKENRLSEFFFNSDLYKQCMEEANNRISDDFKIKNLADSNLKKKIYVMDCVRGVLGLKESNTIQDTLVTELLCNCTMEKLLAIGYAFEDLIKIENINDPMFNEIIIPCINEISKSQSNFQPLNSYQSSDIKGLNSKIRVPMIDNLGVGYKIKIAIGGISKYYLFDTGASDLFIDGETEKELLLTGAIKKLNYIGKKEYLLANNEKVNAQLVKVESMSIGEYTLHNVVIGIMDTGMLVCGISFLDKFKKWEVDKENKVLILYK